MSFIPAIYEQGVFRPTEPVDLPENCQVVLQVQRSVPETSRNIGGPNIETKLAALASQVPTGKWQQLPSDLSDQLDHHVYGTPKQ